ncbi:hypothetical protein KY284_007742 [Solanum tuberosum]|nr:hypothetical protein KY284_007742 [Solanum tuberosum]
MVEVSLHSFCNDLIDNLVRSVAQTNRFVVFHHTSIDTLWDEAQEGGVHDMIHSVGFKVGLKMVVELWESGCKEFSGVKMGEETGDMDYNFFRASKFIPVSSLKRRMQFLLLLLIVEIWKKLVLALP